MSGLILDPFGGPGGWAEGLRMLQLQEIGIELDPSACATRAVAGHRTIRADVTRMPIDHLTGKVDGLIMCPPCQAFSSAGKGEGRDLLDAYRGDIDRGDWACRTAHGNAGAEVLEVGRWAETIRPTWIACEQVPPVLPLWQAYADRWRALHGWSCWAGLLCAADYGVPQTRTRAFLLARTDGRPARPPEPTHCKGGAAGLFGDLAPWVSMAEALGWVGQDQPARTLCGDRSPRWLYPDPDGTHGRVVTLHANRDQWAFDRPATTIAGDPRLSGPGRNDPDTPGSQYGENSVKLTLAEALILQSFRPDYPVQGTKTKQFEQVGNACPPLLSAHVIAALTGRILQALEGAA